MKVVGIVAEYNPFHLGHAYQVQYAKETLGADAVVVVMSGPFTQRGTPAIFDKYTRAKAATSCGVDLVLELPVCFATASAEGFAEGALKVLSGTGIVDTLLFGCETPDIEALNAVASLLVEEPEVYQTLLKEALKNGDSYAKARAHALSILGYQEIIDSPNNILAVEYLKAIKKLDLSMEAVAMQRIGSSYHDTEITKDYASATAIRNAIAKGDIDTVLSAVPNACRAIYKEVLDNHCFLLSNDISVPMHYALLETSELSLFSDCSNELSNKILHALPNYATFDSFCDTLKSKNYTHTRISRALCHILLRISNEDINNFSKKNKATYLRLLAANTTGQALMKEIKKRGYAKLITSPKELSDNKMLAYDVFAADLYRSLLTSKTRKTYPTEYTRKFTLS